MIWLYQTVRIDNLNQQEIDNILAKMGKDKPDGWELVTIYNGLAYFKKPDIKAMEYEQRQKQIRVSRVRGRKVREFMEAVDDRRLGSR
jgi:hypothetical protein